MAKKKKKQKVKIQLWVVLLILVLLIVGLVNGILHLTNKKGKANNSDNNSKVATSAGVQEEKTTSVSLVMVGDNLIHSSVYRDANRLAGGGNNYDFKPIIEYIKEKVQNYDLAYYNQETVLGGTELGLSDYPTFNSPQEAGDAMIDAGFNIVSLATNHTMDRGEKAILSSIEYWKKHDDVLAVGTYTSEEERNTVQIREKNGIKYAMLSYTYGTNGINVPAGKDYLVNVWPTDLNINDPSRDKEYQAYKEQVKKDIEAVRNQVDVLMVAMHWGVEYTHVPTKYQEDSAQFLADNGVDIVIGAHPHVIQPVTWIDDTLVIYSLGNFVSAQLQDQNYNKMVGLMTSLNITKTVKGDDVKITIDNVDNELIFTSYNKNTWSNFKVIPFSNENIGKYLPNYKSVYETYKKVVQNLDPNMHVVPAYGDEEE